MEIVKTKNGDTLILEISGKLSAATAEEFGTAVDSAIAESAVLVLDFKEVSYLASAGLRVLVSAQKQISAKSGSLALINVAEDVYDVFEVTGLDDVFDIK